jgi:hypothetical protein
MKMVGKSKPREKNRDVSGFFPPSNPITAIVWDFYAPFLCIFKKQFDNGAISSKAGK